MALPWLDAARYADTNGFQQDGDTCQWVWRDWVVKAFNDEHAVRPVHRSSTRRRPPAEADAVEQKIATGFNRNHLLNGEGGAIAEEQRFVNLFDRVDTTATTWLGLTSPAPSATTTSIDPITQTDYYGLLAAFNHVPESGTPQRRSVADPRRRPGRRARRRRSRRRRSPSSRRRSRPSVETKLAADAADAWQAMVCAERRVPPSEGDPRRTPATRRRRQERPRRRSSTGVLRREGRAGTRRKLLDGSAGGRRSSSTTTAAISSRG